MSYRKSAGTFWNVHGELVELMEWNGCLVRVRSIEQQSTRPWLVSPEILQPVSEEEVRACLDMREHFAFGSAE